MHTDAKKILNNNLLDMNEHKKAYTTPTLQKQGSIRNRTAGGSIIKNENGGHPDGRL